MYTSRSNLNIWVNEQRWVILPANGCNRSNISSFGSPSWLSLAALYENLLKWATKCLSQGRSRDMFTYQSTSWRLSWPCKTTSVFFRNWTGSSGHDRQDAVNKACCQRQQKKQKKNSMSDFSHSGTNIHNLVNEIIELPWSQGLYNVNIICS